jgi:hypothetical protein
MNNMRINHFLRLGRCCLLVALVAGCQKREIYPVEGKVVFDDGQPASELQGGLVVLSAAERDASARGVILADGSFRLSTNGNDDGAYLGKHQVQIGIPRSLPEIGNQRVFSMDRRFTRFDTSGLEVVVGPKQNEITLTLQRRTN